MIQFGATLFVGFGIQEHFFLMCCMQQVFSFGTFTVMILLLVKLGEARSFLPVFMGLAMARCLGWLGI